MLRADGRRADRDLRTYHYKWMMRQMAERGVGSGKRYPLWAYASHKPDLRGCGPMTIPSGIPLVRIELELDASKALLSDLDAWSLAICNGYVPKNQEDQESYEAMWDFIKEKHLSQGLSGKEAYDRTLKDLQLVYEASWLRVFDLEEMRKYFSLPEMGTPSSIQVVQACFEEISLAHVIRTDLFKARTRG